MNGLQFDRRTVLGGLLMCTVWGAPRSNASNVAVKTIALGPAWTGADLHFAADGPADLTFAVYLNPDRQPTISRVDHRSGAVESISFGSACDGFDPHREVKIFIDDNDILHVSGFMHADALRYGCVNIHEPIRRFQSLDRMTGRCEEAVTYPRFLGLPGGRVLFTYRYGKSGAGETRFKVFERGRWSEVGDGALLGSRASADHSSAYLYDPVVGPDGMVHIVWNWRRTADVATSYDIGYAKSRDLTVWYDAAGRRLDDPIVPSSSAVVDPVGENRGLMGPPRIGFDRAGQPLITYLKFDDEGATQVFLARWRSQAWSIQPITHWTYRWDLHGYGTVLPIISTLPLRPNDSNGYVLEYNHQKEGFCRLTLDAAFRAVGCGIGPRPKATAPLPSRTDIPLGFLEHRLTVPRDMPRRRVLSWVYQPIVGDVRPPCTSDRPHACNPPPRPILLFVS